MSLPKRIQAFLTALQPFEELEKKPPAPEVKPVECVHWGGVELDARQNMHFCLVGTTRSGKTTLLRLLMQDVLPPILERPHTQALIYDPKHEVHAILDGLGLNSCTITLDPFDAESTAWAIHQDVGDDKTAEEVARVLVPEEKSANGGESFFSKAFRNLVTAVICSFQRHGATWTLRDLLIGLSDLEATYEIVRRYSDTARSFSNTIQRTETTQDIVASIENFRNQYRVIAALWHRAALERPPISVRKWLNSSSVLVLPGPRLEGGPITVLNQVIFQRIVEGLLARGEVQQLPPELRPRTWVIVDELRTAGELIGLESLLSKTASKGCRVVIGIQAVEGLKDAQGENRAEEILGLCHNRAFLRAPSAYTAEWMSKQFHNKVTERGERSVTSGPGGSSETWAYRRVEEPYVRPEVFLNLASPEWSNKLEGYFIAPSDRHARYHSEVTTDRLFKGPRAFVKDKGSKISRSQRPPSQQELLPWGLDDLHRLGLPPYLVGRLVQGQFETLRQAE